MTLKTKNEVISMVGVLYWVILIVVALTPDSSRFSWAIIWVGVGYIVGRRVEVWRTTQEPSTK